MLYGIIGILVIIIIILGIKLRQKISVDNKQLEIYKKEISDAQNQVEKLHFQKDELTKDVKTQTDLVSEYNDKIIEIQNKYKRELNKKTTDLDLYFENQKLTRQSEMDTDFERLWREKEENLKECKWVSGNKSTMILGLIEGTYYLEETIAPEGYELNKNRVEFKIKADGTITKVEMKNELVVKVPDTLSARSALLIAISMFDIALGIGIITYVKKNKVEE